MKHVKRLAVILLAVLMVFGVSSSVFAADDYSITINSSTTGHTYEAYQVFKGSVNEKGVLTDVQWGSGVNSGDLLTALKADATIGSKFTNAATAKDVANAMADVESESADAKAFAQVVGANLSTAVAGTSTYAGSAYTIDLDNVGAGYYFVKDKDNTLDTTSDAYTRFILKVVGKAVAEPKSSVPSVEKKVQENVKYTEDKGYGAGYNDVADYNIGDSVPFELIGTLPSNYADYTTYNYVFTDTASTGLTFNQDSVTVSLVNGTTTTVIPAADYTTAFDGQTMTVTFANLKTNTAITADSKIVVKYSATLNANAEIGLDGNENKVTLTYSNNPNTGGTGDTGKTPEDKVIVFTYELDVTKVDGTDAAKTLAGAEFKLYKLNGTTKTYATVVNGKVTGWTETEADGTTLTSDADGLFKVAGLDDGTYYLKETKAPDGYNLLANDTKLVISATTANGQTWSGTSDPAAALTALTIAVNNGTATAGDTTTGVVGATVSNNAGSTLPSTGSIGTKVFYLLGGLIVVGTAVLLVVRKRMNYEK